MHSWKPAVWKPAHHMFKNCICPLRRKCLDLHAVHFLNSHWVRQSKSKVHLFHLFECSCNSKVPASFSSEFVFSKIPSVHPTNFLWEILRSSNYGWFAWHSSTQSDRVRSMKWSWKCLSDLANNRKVNMRIIFCT